MFPGASRVLRDGRHSVYFSRLVSGPPLSSRYPAILVAAILSALLAPTWVRNFSAFISSRRLSLSKAAAFGMLSDRPMHKGAVARHLIVFDRLGAAATRPVSIVTLSPNPRPFPHPRRRCHLSPGRAWSAAASLSFSNTCSRRSIWPCVFSRCVITACVSSASRPKNHHFCAVNILQLHQNRSLSVFSTMGISF
jgi:hypothetical protein